MARYSNTEFDPHYRQHAKQEARADFARAQETEKLKERAKNYVPGYGNPSPRNMGGGLTPKDKWDSQFAPTLGGAAQKAAAAPTRAAQPPVSGTTAVNPRVPATGWISPTQNDAATIASRYSTSAPAAAAPAITPPTPIVATGNPNALQPGQGWQSPTIDPRKASTVVAPDGIVERVGAEPGKGGGNIASMYRPNEYKGPGESPTGVVHNAPTPVIPRQIEDQIISAIPAVQQAGSPENLAFVKAFKATGDHQAAMQAALAASTQTAAALPI